MLQLRLDIPTLRALFPENSNAQIELSQAVVAEIVRKLPANFDLQDAVTTAIAKLPPVEGMMKTHYSSNGLTSGILNQIQKEAERVRNQYIEETVRRKSTEMSEEWFEKVDQLIEEAVNKRLNLLEESIKLQVNNLITAKVSAIVKSVG